VNKLNIKFIKINIIHSILFFMIVLMIMIVLKIMVILVIVVVFMVMLMCVRVA
jgi:hypothetical protein